MSIRKKITWLFLISLFIMFSLSFWVQKIDEHKNQQIVIAQLLLDAKEILPFIVDINDKKLSYKLKELNLKKTDQHKGKNIFVKEITFGFVEVLKVKNRYVLHIEYLEEKYFFETQGKFFEDNSYITSLLFIADIFMLFFIYFVILKIISPVNVLSIKMQKFAKGDFDIRMNENGAKEIKRASKSFNKMAKTLKESIEDRENLLRYFGHEIRTPLAKAKYAFEKGDFNLLKTNLLEIENFVDEVLNLHLINEKNLYKNRFKAHTLIIKSLNKSNIKDESSIKVIVENDFDLYVDINYMSIALKNLIDNALKYSDRFPVEIVAKDHQISVLSYGKVLKEDLSFYTKVFNKNTKKGLGLGLSLAKLIIEKHEYKLFYDAKEGKNIFSIIFSFT